MVGALVQELGLAEGVAGEAAALLDEVKGALLAAPPVGGRSVRNTAFCGFNLRFLCRAC
jgi:retinoblastoma-like protein 1